ncbi:retrovirus-related pol polyprotein from transposon 17.6 [Tanacetum coccineum]
MANTRQTTIMNPEPNDALRDTIAALIREEIEKMRVEMRNVASSSTTGQNGARRQWDKMLGGGCLNVSGFSRWMVLQRARRRAILQRSGSSYDDPLVEIKKIKHVKSVQEYIDEYDKLLCRVELSEEQSISFFLAGLQNDVEVAVRMFKPRSLVELYGLAKLQEANLNAMRIVVDNDEEDIVWEPTNEDVDYELSDVINVVQEESTYPLQVTVANGNNIMSNKICRMKWSLQGEEFVADMMILPLEGCETVLGIQWLSTLGNIICNFRDLKMIFQYKGRTINLRGSQKGIVQWLQGKQLAKNMGVQAQLSFMVLCVYPESVLNMVSAKPTKNDVPKGLQTLLEDYNDVFAVLKELPPVRSHDHIIPLKEGSPTVNIRPYRYPATQKDAIESMVQELLDAGVIRHSQSPFSSLIVMVKKKDGSWRMCVDYRTFEIGIANNKAASTKSKHVISDTRVATDPTKNQVMKKWHVPKNLKQLRGFSGLTGYYRRFIKDYAMIKSMMVAPVLKLPNFEEDFVVETDASGEGIRSVLQQQGHPVAYLSKALSLKHQMLSTSEKKFLAVLQALDK